jgi:hypothetical protein
MRRASLFAAGIAVLALAATGCAREEPLPGDAQPITAPVALMGGECVGPQALAEGWGLYSQKLDIDDDRSKIGLVLLRSPAPGGLFQSKEREGIIDIQLRDLTNYPDFTGRRSYDDVIRETARRSPGERVSEQYGPLLLSGYRTARDTQLFIANDANETLLTCVPPGAADEQAECRVTSDIRDSRYRIVTAMAYDQRGAFREMIAQAEKQALSVFVPCPV